MLSAYFMDQLIFNRWPNVWHRLRMRLRPNDLYQRSIHLLRIGCSLRARDDGDRKQLDEQANI